MTSYQQQFGMQPEAFSSDGLAHVNGSIARLRTHFMQVDAITEKLMHVLSISAMSGQVIIRTQ